jgi:23S rRNA (uracil1939-C5)-methyltransferase
MKIKIESIVYPGKSFSKICGKPVFLDEGMPGEVVEASLLRERQDYVEAGVIRITEPSDRRVKPRCGHYKTCSPYQYIPYEDQIKIKEEQFRNILSRRIAEDRPNVYIRHSPIQWGYRNKAHFHIVKVKNRLRLAYHDIGSHNKYVPVDRCYLVSKKISLMLQELITLIDRNGLSFIKEIVAQESSYYSGRLLLALYIDKIKRARHLDSHLSVLKKRFSIDTLLSINIKTKQRAVVWGDGYLEDSICGMRFFRGAETFFQVNTPTLESMVDDLRSEVSSIEPRRLLDMYCGIGTFGILLSPFVDEVSGVEVSSENIFYAKKNRAVNNVRGFSLIKGDCESSGLKVRGEDPDLIILDPPRRGLQAMLCKRLNEAGPSFICYISCNPSTLDRDISFLRETYRLKSLGMYDFFPQTPHIECLAIMERRRSS